MIHQPATLDKGLLSGSSEKVTSAFTAGERPDCGTLSGTKRGRMVPSTSPPPRGPTLREAVDTFLSCPRCANPNTRRAYAAALDGVLAGLGPDRLLATLASDELAAVFATTWADAAPATWNRNRAAVSSWLAWCAKNRWNAPVLPPVLERRREHANHTKAAGFKQHTGPARDL
jgi:hypothetical protein